MSTDTKNPDPDTILLLQEIAREADRHRCRVILIPEGLLFRRVSGDKHVEHMITWLEMRNVVGGPLWVVQAKLGHMTKVMESDHG